MSKPLGIDKITLFAPVSDVRIEPHLEMRIHNTENAATGRLTSYQQLFFNGDRYVTGQKATYNTDNYQVTIAPDRGGGAPNCIVQWSARAFAGSNEVPMDRDRVAQSARDARIELSDAGLHFPIDTARLVRLDLAKNIEMLEPVECYTPVFGALSGRKSMNKQDFGGTGFLMGNTQRQVAFYDKGAEMRAFGPDLDDYPVNTIRPECRLLKGRVVQQSLGVETVPDLLRGWEKIPSTYVHSMEQDVFRPKMEAKIGASLDFYQEAKFIMDSEYMRKWQGFKSDATPLMLVDKFGLEYAKHFVAFELVADPDSAAGKRQVKRMHLELEQAAFAIKMGELKTESAPLQALYKELRQKVLSL